jgi:hypothetical protein
VEVIELCEEVKAARQEALTWGKELQIGLLLGRLDLGLLDGQTLLSLVEAFQKDLSLPSNRYHHQCNNSSKAKHQGIYGKSEVPRTCLCF